VPIVITDTAGLHVASETVEAIGVERTKREAADSDLLLVVIDGSEPITEEDRCALPEAAGRPHVIALNKSDLATFSATRLADDSLLEPKSSVIVPVSAKTGDGVDELQATIIEPLTNGTANGDSLMITNARHHDLLTRASNAVLSSERLLAQHATEELILVGLHDALRYLGDITGETTSDEILGEIFSTFCIGK
jgi:tRNA modification GTPase